MGSLDRLRYRQRWFVLPELHASKLTLLLISGTILGEVSLRMIPKGLERYELKHRVLGRKLHRFQVLVPRSSREA